jgi:hypothetical protein
MSLTCTAIAGGVEFAVVVSPGSSQSKVRGVHGAALKVAVRAPPEKGRANEEVVAVLAEFFELPPRNIAVVSGETSRQKRVRVLGLDAQAVAAKLDLSRP